MGYKIPDHRNEFEVKVRINRENYRRLERAAMLAKKQKAPYARDIIEAALAELEQDDPADNADEDYALLCAN